MKYLKSFHKLNESLLDDILKGKMYQQLEYIEFDDIRVELSETYGKEDFSINDIKRIKVLINQYLCQDKTPFEIKSIESGNSRVLGQTITNYIVVHIKTGDIDYGCLIEIYKYGDEYFVLNLVIPVAYPSYVTDSKGYISKTEEWYLIDGWDGFSEWATKTTPFNKNTKMFNLFTIPINDYKSGDKMKPSFVNTILNKYYSIRDWSKKTNYFFDNGFHFGNLVQKGIEDYFYGDGTLQSNGLRDESRNVDYSSLL
jgi:hypothetical protein